MQQNNHCCCSCCCCCYYYCGSSSSIMRGCWYVPSPTRKETSYSDQTQDLFNILPHEAQYTSYPVALTFASHSKNFRRLSIQPGLRGSKWPPLQTKNGNLSIVFPVQGTGASPTGPDPENRVGDQDIGSPGRPVSSGLQVPGELGHCHARTRPFWWPSRGIFPSKYPSIAPGEMSNTLHW